ncbi:MULTISPECIES: hypothetical protein [Streptomyces]|uniref:Knr4/Smi1-like domain-containing protein n=1 Tax=Streptomyces clavifer TaxID=68188 RepID=A0ABS4V191_9ACTN|nr:MULTISPECIES: hypothetical protein [Streptomyces]KQX92320.1 hypothetical protein ASD26_22625 [Streptomyces sp. Root1319]KQZ18626.1 hypothetical protein ASD51_29490 [Streptomyces sp. Root55]MBP2357682.1 hypothetical protein [Streptomyces clavifer]MDX2747708.1 hypothetical protein [Streptomyces sp. NRRL_B-2557]WRY85507.1 hypothetical protein OG388_31880 [Streptomyces clavifer]
MNYIESEHLAQWISSGRASVPPQEACVKFHDYLVEFPWLPTRLDWRNIDHEEVDASDVSEDEFVSRALRYRVGSHSHLLALFSPEQPGIICSMSDGLSNLDFIFWKAPGIRYFCGIDLDPSGVPQYHYEDFGEFDGFAKVTFRL